MLPFVLSGVFCPSLCLHRTDPDVTEADGLAGVAVHLQADGAVAVLAHLGMADVLGCSPLDLLGIDAPAPHPVRIPVYGRVAAGIPMEAIQEIIDWEEIASVMASDGEYFALQIHGDSMEPKISNGDVVIVRKQETADDGDLVIALVNGNDAVCKRLKRYDNGTLALISTNPAYDPMYFTKSEIDNTPVRILGKVKELRAKF